jgi:hypothetical protein
MSSELKKGLWLGAAIVVAAALAFAGPSIIAGVSDTAVASDGCGMAHGSSAAECGMTGNTGAASMQAAHQGCAMLTGQVVAVDKRKGSVTVKIKPAAVGGDSAKKALSQAKVGDNLAMAIMLGKDGRPISPNTGAAVQAAKYACPMHPEVTSDKPGKCSKCGMNLERVPEPKG